MPYALNQYRAPRQRAGLSAAQIVKLAKSAMQLKKAYQAEKKKAPPRKQRADKGKPRGPRKATATRPKGRLAAYNPNRVVYDTKIKPSMKLKQMYKRYPQTLMQQYFITSATAYESLNGDADGTVTNMDQIYSTSSVSWENSSIMVMNVSATEMHWQPLTTLAPNNGFRTGTQLTNTASGSEIGIDTNLNDAFLYVNDATNTSLESRITPFRQTGLAENALGSFAITGGTNPGIVQYMTPNSVLQGISWHFKLTNPLIVPIKLSIKVVKYNDGSSTLRPGSVGADDLERQDFVRTLTNACSWTDPQKFTTLHTESHTLPGLRSGTKLRVKKSTKFLSLNYLRTQYRKSYNSGNFATIGLQAKPSYTVADDQSMFNSVFIVVSAKCVDDQYIADVSVETGTGSPEYLEHMPQIATYPPIGIPATELAGKYKAIANGCQFGIAGSVKVSHRVEAIRRSIGGEAVTAINNLQTQLDVLKDENKKKTKALKIMRDENTSEDEA